MKCFKLTSLFCCFVCCCLFSPVKAQQDNRFEASKQLDIVNALVKEVEMFYVDTIEVEKMIRRGIDAMLKGLDPYTEYYPEQEMDVLQALATGEYGGIGSYIQQREEGVIITEPFEGMPAQLAGLRAGDRLLAIDSTDVTRASSEHVSELLKGVPNTKITLKIQRPGEKKPRTIEVLRKKVMINQVVHYGVYGNKTGYIYLSGFTGNCAQEVKTAFEDLKKNQQIESLVLDLRNNGGGRLESAVQIVNYFIPKGKEVLSTRGKIKQRDQVYRTPLDPIDTVMPLAVLINGASASAAEIVAGALQDLDRAVLVGERSFGKGLVQTTRELPYDGNLKVTISKYYIPSGRCIQHMDYSHRNADGSVAAIPDSLTTVFYTSHGRPVRDGGGIRPDFEVEEPKIPTIMYYLMSENMIFDYATDWAGQHPTIAPIDQFTYSDEAYEQFKKYLHDKNFTYDRQSEKVLKNLKEVAEFEGYLEDDSTLFAALEAKLVPNLNRDLERYKDPIKKMIATEVVKRYYYQRGEIAESLKGDPILGKALDVINDRVLYRNTLNPTLPVAIE